MNILVVCQYYYPEPFRISDICEELVKRGHNVTVITGIPNYPMGQIYDGYRHGEKRDEIINGVKIHRCFTIGRRSGTIWRFLNYYSFMFSSSHYVLRLKEEFDVVFVNQLSPVMMANAGIKYKRKHNKKLILYCLDLWPESLVAGGIKKDSVIYKFFYRISSKIYKAADSILITSNSFSKYFEEEFGITDTKYLPQYAEALFTPEMCKKQPNDTIDLMFAGNVGVAQSMNTIIRAAVLTQDIPNLRWHIVGDGSESEKLQAMAQGMNQVIFHGRKSLEEMPAYYSMADAMLVTMQKDPVLSLTLPGKVQTYMAAGKPIIGAIDGETPLVIAKAGCGICCGAEDAVALAANVRSFVMMDREQLGNNARAYYDEHFDKRMFIAELEEKLEKKKENDS